MFNPQMTSSQMELLPLVCLCLLSWSGTTSADQPESVLKEEGSDAILRCSFGVNIEQEKLEWKKDGQQEVFVYDSGIHHNNGRPGQDEQFKGRVSHFQDELKHGNASILIRNTKVADSGDYTCDIPHDPSSKIVHVQLVVGAAPEPSITLNQTENSALLQCKVNGVPDLKVEWKDSDGNILAEDQRDSGTDRVSITLLTTVTKTGIFHCVATQKNIKHTISNQVQVYFQEQRTSAVHRLSHTFADLRHSRSLAQVTCKQPEVEVEDGDSNLLPADEQHVSETGRCYNITLLTTATKTTTKALSCAAQQEESV